MNLEKYASYVRGKAASSFSEEYDEDLDDYVSIGQVCKMIEENSLGKDEAGRYLLDETGYDRLFDSLKVRIYNCGLSKLASKNLLECAWDSESNEMIFWALGQT